jgi:hypothetical protein
MRYTLQYANTLLCTPAHGGRADNCGERSRGAAATIVMPTHPCHALRYWRLRVPPGAAAPEFHGRSASRRAGGHSLWLPRSASPRGSPRGSSATKPFVSPCVGCGCPGSEPNTGSPVPLLRMPAKKTARPADPVGHAPADEGAGFWRRSLAEPPRPQYGRRMAGVSGPSRQTIIFQTLRGPGGYEPPWATRPAAG